MAHEDIHIVPIMEYQGHFHTDLSSEKSSIEQISEVIKLILEEMEQNNTPWDQAAEIWMVHTGEYGTDMHVEKWLDCPFNQDPTMKPFDPFRVVEFGNIHPADFLEHCIPAPEESGVFLLAEAWALKLDDLEEGDSYDNWFGRTQEHPKAQEWRQITYCSAEGEFAMGAYARKTKEVQVSFYTLADEDFPEGNLPDALLKFTQNSRPNESWRKKLDRNLS